MSELTHPDIEYRRITPISRNWGADRGLPVDRYYIDRFLRRFHTDIRGQALEVQSDYYTRTYGRGRATAVDVIDLSSQNPRATIVGDLADTGTLPRERFDCIICTQTLQFVYDFHAAIRSLHAMLRPGGVLLATVPGITKIDFHETDYPFLWSFTATAVRRMFGQVFGPPNVLVQSYGNVLTAISFLHGVAANELTIEELDTVDPEYEVTVAVRAVRVDQP